MIFNSFEFLFLFLPAVLVLFFLPKTNRARPYVLILASFVFYGIAGIEHAVVLALDIAWVYFIVTRDRFAQSRWMLALAITPPALGLVYYKYLGFLIGSLFDLEPGDTREQFDLFLDIVLPAGISFFTFQVISFAIDVHRGDIKEMPPFKHFALFIGFFPQLVAGPILRYRDVAAGLRQLAHFKLDGDHAARAIGYIVMGLAAKVLLADTMSHAIAEFRADPGHLSALTSGYVVLAYSFQIYFDFYGYSMVAIGSALCSGLPFPKTSNGPTKR